MKNKVYTDERIEFLRIHAKTHKITELTTLFNKEFGLNITKKQLFETLKRNGISLKKVNEKNEKWQMINQILNIAREICGKPTVVMQSPYAEPL